MGSKNKTVLMQESGLDPVTPELLAADRAVAAAARHAIALTKALKVCRLSALECKIGLVAEGVRCL